MIIRLFRKGYDLYSGAKSREDIQRKHTIYILEQIVFKYIPYFRNKKVRLIFDGVLKRTRFIFWNHGQNERRTTKRYDLYSGAKIPKSYDYSTRYVY